MGKRIKLELSQPEKISPSIMKFIGADAITTPDLYPNIVAMEMPLVNFLHLVKLAKGAKPKDIASGPYLIVNRDNIIFTGNKSKQEAYQDYIRAVDIISQRADEDLPRGMIKRTAMIVAKYNLPAFLISRFGIKRKCYAHASYLVDENKFSVVPEYFIRFGVINMLGQFVGEFEKTVLHEFGHTIWYQLLDDEMKREWERIAPAFLDTDAVLASERKEDYYRSTSANLAGEAIESDFYTNRTAPFVSDYARFNIRDDFAESFAFYKIAPVQFNKKFPRRYKFFQVIEKDIMPKKGDVFKKSNKEVINVDTGEEYKVTPFVDVLLQHNKHRRQLASKLERDIRLFVREQGLGINSIKTIVIYDDYSKSANGLPELIKSIIWLPGLNEKKKDRWSYSSHFTIFRDKEDFEKEVFRALDLGTFLSPKALVVEKAGESTKSELYGMLPAVKVGRQVYSGDSTDMHYHIIRDYGLYGRLFYAKGLRAIEGFILRTGRFITRPQAEKMDRDFVLRDDKERFNAYFDFPPGEGFGKFSKAKTRLTRKDLMGMRPAVKMGRKIYTGGPLDLHHDIAVRYGLRDPSWRGFVLPTGRFITYREAKKADADYLMEDEVKRVVAWSEKHKFSKSRKKITEKDLIGMRPAIKVGRKIYLGGQYDFHIDICIKYGLLRGVKKEYGYVLLTGRFVSAKDARGIDEEYVDEDELRRVRISRRWGKLSKRKKPEKDIKFKKPKEVAYVSGKYRFGMDQYHSFRIKFGKQWYDIVTKEGFPNKGATKALFVKSNPPKSGKVNVGGRKGQYTRTKLGLAEVERWGWRKIFRVLGGAYKGRYIAAGKQLRRIEEPAFTAKYLPIRPKGIPTKRMIADKRYEMIPESGGQHVYIYTTPTQNRIISYKKNKKTGKYIDKTNYLSAVRDYSLPVGNVIEAQVFSRDANTTRKVFGTNLVRSRVAQRELGMPKVMATDIIQYAGRDVRSLPYQTRKALLKKVVPDYKYLFKAPSWRADKVRKLKELKKIGWNRVVFKDRLRPLSRRDVSYWDFSEK